MKTKTFQLLFLAVLFIAAFSCTKKDEVKPSKTSILTAKPWILTKVEAAGINVTDAYLDDCDKDDTEKFNTDHTIYENIGTVKCDKDDVNSTGQWSLKENDTVLSITFFGKTIEGKITELTATTLKLSAKDEDTGATIIITFVVV